MLENVRFVSIIREVGADDVLPIMDALREEGIRWFEISLSDGANGMECIRRALEHFCGTDVKVGAGTVTKTEELDVLSRWKLPYILTPGFDRKIVCCAKEKGIEVLPGVLTPSEVQEAVDCGIRLLKLFPADAFSRSYIKALKGPFPQTDYVAVGGVTAENAPEFYRAGFKGVAAGSNLVPRHAGKEAIADIRRIARKYMEAAGYGI